MLRAVLAVALCACGRFDFDPLRDAGAVDCTAFTLADAQVNPSSELELNPVGATGPVQYALAGPGMLVGALFASPPYRSTSMITATDAAGCSATATITTVGGTLFYLGGTVNAVPTAEVWSSNDAITWTRVGTLPQHRASGAGVVFHDAMWLIGGSIDLSPTGQTNVWRSTDGATWTNVAAFPGPVTDCQAIGFHDRLWLACGHGAPGTVWSTADGITWAREGMLPGPYHGGDLLVLGDQLVYEGGHDDTNYFDFELASSDGGGWTNIGTLPSKREFQAVAVHDNLLVFAGGTDAVGYLGDSFHSSDGITWTAGAALPAQRMYSQLQWLNGRFYLVGGTDGGDVWSTADASAWRVETTNLPTPRYAGALLEYTPP